ncbi:calmodulin-binding protein [Pelomyxa schiedti]|nr:calmodulin-binding protein [Pelomyxa schiedti]
MECTRCHCKVAHKYCSLCGSLGTPVAAHTPPSTPPPSGSEKTTSTSTSAATSTPTSTPSPATSPSPGIPQVATNPCPKCKAMVPISFKFCTGCGTSNTQKPVVAAPPPKDSCTCKFCDATLLPKAKFCTACGKSTSLLPAPSSSPVSLQTPNLASASANASATTTTNNNPLTTSSHTSSSSSTPPASQNNNSSTAPAQSSITVPASPSAKTKTRRRSDSSPANPPPPPPAQKETTPKESSGSTPKETQTLKEVPVHKEPPAQKETAPTQKEPTHKESPTPKETPAPKETPVKGEIPIPKETTQQLPSTPSGATGTPSTGEVNSPSTSHAQQAQASRRVIPAQPPPPPPPQKKEAPRTPTSSHTATPPAPPSAPLPPTPQDKLPSTHHTSTTLRHNRLSEPPKSALRPRSDSDPQKDMANGNDMSASTPITNPVCDANPADLPRSDTPKVVAPAKPPRPPAHALPPPPSRPSHPLPAVPPSPNTTSTTQSVTPPLPSTPQVQPQASTSATPINTSSGDFVTRTSSSQAFFVPDEPEDSTLNELERSRLHVMQELCFTEENYVADLEIIISVFLTPLETVDFVTEKDISTIFINIRDLPPVNKQLLVKLQEASAILKAQPHTPPPVGNAFISLQEEITKAYSVYCSGQDVVLQTIDALDKNPKFHEFLIACKQRPECKSLDLKGYLIKPVQRICRYPLLLREMQKLVPHENTEEHEALDSCITFTQGLIAEINASVAHAQKIEHLCSLCETDMNDPSLSAALPTGVKVIRDETLQVVLDKGKAQETYTLLTPSHLFYARPASLFGRCKLVIVDLSSAVVSDSSKFPMGFELEVGAKLFKKKKVHCFVCNNYLQKLLWLQDLKFDLSHSKNPRPSLS